MIKTIIILLTLFILFVLLSVIFYKIKLLFQIKSEMKNCEIDINIVDFTYEDLIEDNYGENELENNSAN